MGKLKALQKQYLEGKITKAQYEAEVKKLLDDETLDQEAYDDALEYDPEAEKPIFTQADVDKMVVAKAVKMVRTELKKAGVDVEADNKTLIAKVAEMAKAGTGKEPPKAADKEVEALRKQAAKAEGLASEIKDLRIENAVLASIGKYNPVNAKQVVRALKQDYMDFVDYDDETGKVDAKTVDRALRKITDAEPNLFNSDGDDEGDQGGKGTGGQGAFRGKGPGGGDSASKGAQDFAKKQEEAREMLRKQGILPKEEPKK